MVPPPQREPVSVKESSRQMKCGDSTVALPVPLYVRPSGGADAVSLTGSVQNRALDGISRSIAPVEASMVPT